MGKEAATVVSDSESTTEHSSLTEILKCLLNLPCLHLKKKESKRPKKWRKMEQDSHYIDHCYLNLPEDMIEKEPYLAFHLHKTIKMSFDAMTTSPVESMNSSIKNGMGVNSNSQTRYVLSKFLLFPEFTF